MPISEAKPRSPCRKRAFLRLVELVEDFDEEDLHFLQQRVDFNERLAEYGLKIGPGLGVGKTLPRLVIQLLLKDDIVFFYNAASAL